MNYCDYINIISIIDKDIFINERVYGNIYEYIKKIVKNYKEYSIIIFLNLVISNNEIYIKIFDNNWFIFEFIFFLFL